MIDYCLRTYSCIFENSGKFLLRFWLFETLLKCVLEILLFIQLYCNYRTFPSLFSLKTLSYNSPCSFSYHSPYVHYFCYICRCVFVYINIHIFLTITRFVHMLHVFCFRLVLDNQLLHSSLCNNNSPSFSISQLLVVLCPELMPLETTTFHVNIRVMLTIRVILVYILLRQLDLKHLTSWSSDS